MKFAIASLSLLLVACQPSQPPADPAPPAAVVAPATPAAETPSAKRVPGQEAVEPLRIFRAFGTEPFWGVNVEGTRLTYTTPENQAGVVMEGTRKTLADGVEISGQHDGKPFVLYPFPTGAHGVQAMAHSPQTGLTYLSARLGTTAGMRICRLW